MPQLRSSPRKRGPRATECGPWIPSISASTRVFDALCAGMNGVGRRTFIALLGAAAAAWPLAARAQRSAIPIVGLVGGGGGDISTRYVTAFRKGLNETGIVEGQNATVEYHWLEGQYDRLRSLMADLVRRGVAVIVFGVGEDPVKLGLVASLARPGGNATGINIFNVEVAAKRLGLLHELVPKAGRIAVLINPANASSAESTLRYIPEAARAIGLQSHVLNASSSDEIDTAFAALVRERADALFVAPDAFFISRRTQFATLTARDRFRRVTRIVRSSKLVG
jgi:ABC transporter substrate binding protein